MHLSNISIKAKYIYTHTHNLWFSLPKCKMLKVVLAILVIVTITTVTNIRSYDSTALIQIQDQSKLKENHCFFSLEPKTRSKIILLGIRAQLKLYRRSRGGKYLFHRIHSIVNNWGQQIHTPGCGIEKSNFALHNKRMHHGNAIIHSCAMVKWQSIVNKTQTIEVEIATHKIDLCALTETWIKQEHNATILACCPPNYKALSMPRPNKTCGRIAIIYKDRLKVSQNSTYQYTMIECTNFIVSPSSKDKNTHIAVI